MEIIKYLLAFVSSCPSSGSATLIGQNSCFDAEGSSRAGGICWEQVDSNIGGRTFSVSNTHISFLPVSLCNHFETRETLTGKERYPSLLPNLNFDRLDHECVNMHMLSAWLETYNQNTNIKCMCQWNLSTKMKSIYRQG